MAKGRYIKSAERACAGKARFETALEAERTCEWRFRAYRCPVCHGFHLTSRAGVALTEPEAPTPAAPKEPGPKLGDLDWSAALDPNPKPKPPRPVKVKPVRPSPPPAPPTRVARCAANPAKDGKVLLVLDGRLVKSQPVKDRALRATLAEGREVTVSIDDPPRILG